VLIARSVRGHDVLDGNWKSKPKSDGQQSNGTQDHSFAESRRLAQESIIELGRDPVGILSDFDQAVTHSGMESESLHPAPAKRRRSRSRAFNNGNVWNAEPPAKRLRRSLHDSGPLSTPGALNVRENRQLERPNPPAVTASKKVMHKPIDYRKVSGAFLI
jgi:hypothetical protein